MACYYLDALHYLMHQLSLPDKSISLFYSGVFSYQIFEGKRTKMMRNIYSKLNFIFIIFFLLILVVYAAHSVLEGSIHGGSLDDDDVDEEEIKLSDFPTGFLFGASTSAYQNEGAFLEDGKTFNNWDAFTHAQANVENGDIADDHYHHFLKDIEIMHSLGVKAYRFSISWARVLPRGRFGGVNPKGIMFYNSIIDNLLLKGLEPFVTIHHNDFPQELEDRYGSWLSPLMQEDFIHFAEICFKSFGDRVKYWVPINEPNIIAVMGYQLGQHPPGHCSEPFANCSRGNSDVEPLIVAHNILLAHGKAAKLYRQHFQPKQGGYIGMVAHCYAFRPLTDDKIGQDAADRAFAFTVAWVYDPVVFGDYPPEMRRYHGSELPTFSPEEKEFMKNSIDFIGINHYSTLYAKDCIHSSCILGGDRPATGFVNLTGYRDGVPIGEPTAKDYFFVVPKGMEEIVKYLQNRYDNIPMFVTENGYASERHKGEREEDVLNDFKRVHYHKTYIASLAKAIREGADVRGYFVWTLMDNYEWAFGYSKRFGLYDVDLKTMNRIPKLSGKWYKRFLNDSTPISEVASTGSNSYRRKL